MKIESPQSLHDKKQEFKKRQAISKCLSKPTQGELKEIPLGDYLWDLQAVQRKG